MSESLELLNEILANAGISSSQEEEILTTIKTETTPPEAKEESISDKEHACEKEIEEDEKWILGDHHANDSCIEQCFQVSTSLNQHCFCFYFINLHFQHLVLHIFIHIKFYFVKSNVNILYFFYMYGSTGNFITRK